MIRKLLIVFVSGLLFAMVLLSSAWVLGGSDMINRIEKGGRWTLGGNSETSPTTSRSLVLGGINALAIEVPVDLTYTKGTKQEMVVSGPANLMKQLR